MAKTTVTPEIIRAVKMATEQVGSEIELAKKTGINQPTLNMLSNGKTKSITQGNWEKLLPYLAPHLKTGANAIVQTINGNHNHNTINATCESAMIDKILKSDLTAEEKLKFIELVRK